MQSSALKVQCQAALALRNLASDDSYQLEIANNPKSLPRLLSLITGNADSAQVGTESGCINAIKSSHPSLILAAVACIRNISIHPSNESKIIEAGFLPPLVALLSNENEEVQCHAISTIRNLAAGSGMTNSTEESSIALQNKEKIMQSGALERIQQLIKDTTHQGSTTSWSVLSEMTACLAVLGLSGTVSFIDGHPTYLLENLKPQLLNSGIVSTLVPLTSADIPSEVQGNAAAALGNLATKGT
jgi:vacuolar protein 8